MTPHEYTCEDTREALAAYVAGSLPTGEAREIERHVAQCAGCAAELAQWRRISALARQDYGPEPTPSFEVAWEQLHTRLTPQQAIAPQHREPWQDQRRLHEVQLDEITRAPTAAPTTGVAHARKPARRGGQMKYMRSFAAVAAVLALAIISAAIFSALAYQRSAGNHGGRQTAAGCSAGNITAQLPQNTNLDDLAMTSPTDGWAVGYTITPATVDEPLILRYHSCKWAPISTPALNGLDNIALNSISLVSPDAGWATGLPGSQLTPTSEILLHYDHGQWQRVNVPNILPGYNWFTKVVALSPDDMWLLVNLQSTDPQHKWTNTLIHFDRGVWSVVTPPFPFIGDMTAVGSDDIFISGAQDWYAQQSMLGRYENGAWSVTSEPGLQLGMLRVLSPTDGWDVASIPSANNMDNEARLVPLHWNGATWSRANLGIPSGAYEMNVVSGSDVWAFNGGMSYHYAHGQWTTEPLPQDLTNLAINNEVTVQSSSSVNPLVRTSDGAYWAIGSYLGSGYTKVEGRMLTSVLLRYADGVWTAYGAS